MSLKTRTMPLKPTVAPMTIKDGLIIRTVAHATPRSPKKTLPITVTGMAAINRAAPTLTRTIRRFPGSDDFNLMTTVQANLFASVWRGFGHCKNRNRSQMSKCSALLVGRPDKHYGSNSRGNQRHYQ